MATNGAQSSANNNAMIVRPKNGLTPDQQLSLDQIVTNMTTGDLTAAQGKNYRLYWQHRFLPGLSTRGIGKLEQCSDFIEGVEFNVIPPEEVTLLNGLIDNLCRKSPDSIAHDFKELFMQLLVTVDAAPTRLVQSLENNLSLRLERHTMNQTRLDRGFDKVQAMHDETQKRLDDFDQKALDRAGHLAQAISDEAVKRSLTELFVPFKTDVDARVQSHKSANEKQQREFEAKLNARIDNINARIDNTTKTECTKALQPHIEELIDAKATVASFREQLGQHVADANTTLGRLKQQQTSTAREMETLRKDKSNLVLSNSSYFQTLRTTVESHGKAIEEINDDISDMMKNGLTVLSGLKIVGQRSRSNREVLRKTLRHVIEVEHVALKLEEALVEVSILDDQGFLKPNENRPQDSRLGKSAYELSHKDNNPLEADPSCITLLQEGESQAQAAGAQAPPPAS